MHLPAAPVEKRAPTSEPVKIASVKVTHPDRVVYLPQGTTKRDVAAYYEWIAPLMLPHLARRPLTLVRCPRGSAQECFFQKHAGRTPFPFTHVVAIQEEKKIGTYYEVDSVQGLISLVQMGVLELHTWGARSDNLEKADRIIFDLDPGPHVPHRRLVEAAKQLKTLVENSGLTLYVATTGGKGFHLVAPLRRRRSWEQVKTFSRDVVETMVRESPDHYIAKAAKAEREGKIFIDYFRNLRGATAVAPYSLRARANAPVATPITWEELFEGVRPNQFTIRNMKQRIERLTADPWEDFPRIHGT